MLTAIHVGADPVLLWSRAAILETAGIRVVNAASVAQSVERIWGVPFELVLLCHSLPRAHRRQIIAAVRRRNPSVPVLLVREGCGDTIAAVEGVDALLAPEPQRLLAGLRRILRLPGADCGDLIPWARCHAGTGSGLSSAKRTQ